MAGEDLNHKDSRVVDGTLRYVGDEQLTSLAAAVALTPPLEARMALISVTGAAVRFRCGGETPTAGLGVALDDGEKFWCNIHSLAGISFIEQTASATIDVQYFN